MDDNMNMTTPPTEEMGNRVFIIGVAVLGGILVLALIVLVVAVIWIRSSSAPAIPPADQTATVQAAAISTVTAMEQTRRAASPTSTPVTPTNTKLAQPVTKAATNTPIPPTNTPLISNATNTEQSTNTSQAQGGAGTSTSATGATLTTKTGTQPTQNKSTTPTGLPKTGFGDDSGLPLLVVAGVALLMVVILARQLRFRHATR